jgi:flagellar hook-associated protein 3 FlgL
MRISTNTIYDLGATKISELQAALVRTQQQISANRRMLSPSDDPIAAARALEVTQSQSLNTQYATNRTYASNSLSLEESVLQSVTSLIQDVKTQTIEAGNAAYDDTQRRYIATDLRGRLEELIGFANTRDSEGNYLFSGFQTSAKAFSSSASGVVYAGDQGQRNLQVGAVRQIAISDSGDSVFGRIRSTGTFGINT